MKTIRQLFLMQVINSDIVINAKNGTKTELNDS